MNNKKDYFPKDYFPAFLFIFFSAVFIIGVSYVTWRWMYTLNLLTSPFTTFWSYALCIAEILTLATFTNFGIILFRTSRLKKVSIDNKLQQDYYTDFYHNDELISFKNYCPSVDIFICTLNETADLLSTTIAACKNIDYPNKKVYVLDDGRREEIRELTALLGCNYITRDNNKGFKAGNINNALKQTNSEIIVIFDADHVAASTFLRETVYNFADENVALVQTPQTFCNPDAFQKNLGLSDFLANEQDMFYRIIEPSLNEFDSVFCGGTNILLRRKHLEEVGNFPETTITEDSLLGLIFHSKGYKIIYYNRPLAIGLSASSFEEYIKQRCRWAKGNVQIVANSHNWKYYTKLKPMQLFFYLTSVLYFFTPIARLIYLFAPVLFLFFDISPLVILFYQIIAFQICYFSLKYIFIYASKINFENVIFADVYDLLTSVFTAGGILQALFIPQKFANIKFSVTKKDFGKTITNYKYIIVVSLLFIIVVAAEMQGIYDLLYSDYYSALAIIANLVWNTSNIIVLAFALKVVTEKPEKRLYQRVRTEEELVVEDSKHHKHKTHLYDASRSGISFTTDEDLGKDIEQDLEADINGEPSFIRVLASSDFKGTHLYKAVFRKPITLFKLTKRKINRLEKYVRLAYKNPDLWDNFLNKFRK